MSEENKGKSGEIHQRLWRRTNIWWLVGIPIGGIIMFMAGIIFWSTFDNLLAYSNTTEFCISCHEMRDFMYEEYKESPHFKNTSGVRAICSDCHVPKPWIQKMGVKMRAGITEIPKKIMGTISTREKFEAKRLELARSVWAKMKADNSAACHNCHSLESMNLEKQSGSARKRHDLKRQLEKGETCIDCHKGIAHKLPEGYEEFN